MNDPDTMLRRIIASAPIRICDNGGWTDTWFAGHGAVFNIAVTPLAEAEIEAYPRAAAEHRVFLHAENFGAAYPLPVERREWGPLPLAEAAIEFIGIPVEFSVSIMLRSDAPAGASTGTSAAITVALLGALEALHGRKPEAYDVAMMAHHVESNILGRQCGIQDQLCSAFGGFNLIEMERFPDARVQQLPVETGIAAELERRLVLVYLGSGHSSSVVHEKVIRELEQEGFSAPRLEPLRSLAKRSAEALLCGDFTALGRAMIENTAAQERLHPDLVCGDARRVIRLAAERGAAGWKVNGAGGEGGSITLLCGGEPAEKAALLRAIEAEDPRFRIIPIALSLAGLRIREGAA